MPCLPSPHLQTHQFEHPPHAVFALLPLLLALLRRLTKRRLHAPQRPAQRAQAQAGFSEVYVLRVRTGRNLGKKKSLIVDHNLPIFCDFTEQKLT